MRFRFIDQHQAEFPVTRLCEVLGVSTSGYYAWKKHALSQRALANQKLVLQIKAVYAENYQAYGRPRIHAELVAQGVRCSEKRVARLMRQHGIRAQQVQRRRVQTTDSNHDLPVAPNLLNRQFEADESGQKWVGDITYIPTRQGWLYLAAIMDLYSRRIVGWAMDEKLTSSLVQQALAMAVAGSCPQAGLLHHSDRGSQYASQEYQQLLAAHQMVVSMSRRGDCYDNAAMESFFSTLKCERVHYQHYATPEEAKRDLFAYIELFYNRRRRHSALGYLSPAQYEQQHQSVS
jgi:putative transposase